ncbi:RNA methyltransferase [Pararhodospirillum oryzae]|uniref:rRNA methyltransferase n=1 Tax=Pararhodospirillum oryzae TaxID=478448 RepID=A0A512H4B4_9PROT|nr:RNA methyltransferase [Pararhodospirillum oryzae]GEO80305.1 rRNA methyltransferase [Pararhodospirillum oryzae]
MESRLRGYFGIGIEGVSKPYNLGNVFRTAHAFDAAFVFTIRASYAQEEVGKVDTSDALAALPFYRFPDVADLVVPSGCQVVGIELTDDAIDLPSFRHPVRAVYVLGAERVGLSDAMLARCDHVVKIPMRFSINLGMAGALVMYDRLTTLGRFAPRPVRSGGPTEPLAGHRHGTAFFRSSEAQRLARWQGAPPMAEVADARGKD